MEINQPKSVKLKMGGRRRWCILAVVVLSIMSVLIRREETNPEYFFTGL
jgi:hypothetical protein